jgi:hypothetical protein
MGLTDGRDCLGADGLHESSAQHAISMHRDQVPNSPPIRRSLARKSAPGPNPPPGRTVEFRQRTMSCSSNPATVLYDIVSGEPLTVVGVDGTLRFRTDIDTRMKVGTLLVAPHSQLEIGTETKPIAANVTAEVIIAEQPIARITPDRIPSLGPEQWGTGLLGLGRYPSWRPKDPDMGTLGCRTDGGDRLLAIRPPLRAGGPATS